MALVLAVAALVLVLMPGSARPRHRWPAALRRRKAARVTRGSALAWLDACVAELRAGRAPADALRAACAGIDPVPCPRAVAAAQWGGDVPAALRRDADGGATSRGPVPVLRSVAACWAVTEATGAGLGDALEDVLASARADDEVRREVAGQLAAPRATARVLAVLPLFGVALGTAMGAAPLAWLTGSALGVVVLMAGVGLAAAGVAWTSALARRVERRLDAAPC